MKSGPRRFTTLFLANAEMVPDLIWALRNAFSYRSQKTKGPK